MAPDLAEPEDQGEDLSTPDLPIEMVCAPGAARCTDSGDREQCSSNGERFEAAPCEGGELCEGDGMCVACGSDPNEICELTRFDASGGSQEGCLGQSILAIDDLVIIGNPCIIGGTGAVQVADLTDGTLQVESGLGTGESLGVRFGASLAVLDNNLFVGEPGNGGGAIRFIPRFEGGVESNFCQLRPEDPNGGHAAWGYNIKILAEQRLLLVADSRATGNSTGRLYLYDISETPDCSNPGDILRQRAVIVPEPGAGNPQDFGAAFDARLVNNTLEIVIGAPTGEGELYFAEFPLVLAEPASDGELVASLIASGGVSEVSGLGAAVLFDNAKNRVFVTARDPDSGAPLFVMTLQDGAGAPVFEPVEVEGIDFDVSYELGRSLLSEGGGLWTTASSMGEDFWLHIALVEPMLMGIPLKGKVERVLELPREGATDLTPTGLGAAMVVSPEKDHLITGAPEWVSAENDTKRGAVFVLGIGED